MANPKYHYEGSEGISEKRDSSAKYADATGHVLHFEDARRDIGSTENYVTFVAFLTSFSQAFSSNWNTEEVYGRMDPIATFKNTTRTISVAWDIPSKTPINADDNLNRCNQLISMLYPTYHRQDNETTNALSLSKPPLIRMRYANLIAGKNGAGLLGFISSINWNPVVEMGYFHRGSNLYPKVIQISVEFQAIHAEELGWNSEGKTIHGDSDPSTHEIDWPFKK